MSENLPFKEIRDLALSYISLQKKFYSPYKNKDGKVHDNNF